MKTLILLQLLMNPLIQHFVLFFLVLRPAWDILIECR